jgi:hypothetical protein
VLTAVVREGEDAFNDEPNNNLLKTALLAPKLFSFASAR